MAERPFELPPRAFRFELGIRRGTPDFFRNTSADAPLLAERRGWLKVDSPRYAIATPESKRLLEAALYFARSVNPTLKVEAADPAALGAAWAPDFLLLSPDTTGAFLLRAGCVCFPSHWDLGAKVGLPLTQIHAPVPTLNDSLARQIDGFLAALRPGAIWERWNWGLAATPERNNHPSRALPRLQATTSLSEIWLRLERQAFIRLAQTDTLLFAIRLVIEPLRETTREPQAAERLAHLLESMPEAVANYKGVAAVRPSLIATLRAARA